MGADNTMVILKNRGKGAKTEFRVRLVTGAENLCPLHNESEEQLMARRWFLLTWFQGAKIYDEARKARSAARHKLRRLRRRGRLVEYGVRTLDFTNEPFPSMSLREVELWLRRRKAFPFQTG